MKGQYLKTIIWCSLRLLLPLLDPTGLCPGLACVWTCCWARTQQNPPPPPSSTRKGFTVFHSKRAGSVLRRRSG